MKVLDVIKSIQTALGVKPDGDFGNVSHGALDRLIAADPKAEWQEQPVEAQHGAILRGDGSFPWTAEIDGDDIVIRNARATCFGGSNDPQDSGDTASGISTKRNPSLMACSLPMNYQGPNGPTRKALSGSPIPMIPWKTVVRVTSGGKTLDVPVIDLGPAKYTGNQVDLTIAAARFFKPSASATNFEMQCTVRIIGGAKYATT